MLARQLHRRHQLLALITDAWASPGGVAARLPGSPGQRLAERYESELADARVVQFTGPLLLFELMQRLRGRTGWEAIIARNQWFGRQAARALRRHDLLAERPVVFAYSYAAREVFQAARAAGCVTVLGQIDPGQFEENLVADAVVRHGELAPHWRRAPSTYWADWRDECDLADHIVVNSEWAREGLIRAGVESSKLRVVPLAYEPPATREGHDWPPQFDDARPLRLLFLGSFILRKGAAELLEAARLLRDEPVEFHIVGGCDVRVPDADLANPRLVFHGPTPRGQVHAHFDASDLFILPTLSDGFGLTLLEAQAHGLPVIASARCGEVVRDGTDGVVLEEVTGPAIAAAIRSYLSDPTRLSLQSLAARASVDRFTPERVADQLLAIL